MTQQAQVTTISAPFGAVRLMRDATLGTGAYGQVCKATLDGKPCAAKLLHPILVDSNNPRNLRKFEQECRLLSEIRHPNIVQCLGVAKDEESGLPVLLMELMEDSLTHFLEQSEDPLAIHVQVNISHDIALAVAFLHSKHILHRDLSSNNVLLCDAGSKAKVTDFGMTKLDSHMTGLTRCPGTAAYMAPEAMLDPPVYTEKLDCFQIGVLITQVITRKFPDPGPAMNRVRDERYPTGWINAPVPEVKRRQNHLSLVLQTHPLLLIAVDCLKDTDSARPSAQQICECLSVLKEVSQYGHSLLKEKEQQIQQLRQENQERVKEAREKEKKIKENEREAHERNREIRNLQSQLMQMKKDIKRIEKEKDMKVKEIGWENESLRKELREKEKAVLVKDGEIHNLREALGSKTQLLLKKGKLLPPDAYSEVGRIDLQPKRQLAVDDLSGPNGPLCPHWPLSEPYDILLLGRTGRGKSTTANKLLGIEQQQGFEGAMLNKLWEQVEGAVEGAAKYLEIGKSTQPVTEKCKLISHQSTTIRVLDTPGFVNSKKTKGHKLMESNLHIFQSILEEQEINGLAFRRVLYFLPKRGPPECAEETLQKEIEIMYEYMGQDIFKVMVIIATNKPKSKCQVEFTKEDIDQVEEVFTQVFNKIVTDYTLPFCPPVVYLPVAPDPDLVDKIVLAKVISSTPIKLRGDKIEKQTSSQTF